MNRGRWRELYFFLFCTSDFVLAHQIFSNNGHHAVKYRSCFSRSWCTIKCHNVDKLKLNTRSVCEYYCITVTIKLSTIWANKLQATWMFKRSIITASARAKRLWIVSVFCVFKNFSTASCYWIFMKFSESFTRASTPLEHWGGRRSSAEDARIEAP